MKQPKISLNLTKYHKENTHPTTFHEEFFHLKNNHPNHICIYTDGSKNGNKVSCAATQHTTKITKRLPSSSSIYGVETKAVDLALNIITQTESTELIIFFWLLTSLKKTLDNPLTMQLLNWLEIVSKTKEIEQCWIKSHIRIKGNDHADSAAKTAWKMPIDKSFKILYTDLKTETKKLYSKQMAIKMIQHPTQQTPDYKSWNRRMEGRIQKILQGRDYPISSTYWTHRHHPLISTQIRTTTMVCGMSHFIFSKTPIDRLHRPNAKKTSTL